MGMFETLENLGSKLFSKSGEGGDTLAADFGESKQTHNREAFLKGLFDVHQLTSLLPYATFDPETDLFYNQDSLGFVVETEPLVGASSDIQVQIQNFFNTAMPTESAMQVILYADPLIGEQMNRYQNTRKDAPPILKEMVIFPGKDYVNGGIYSIQNK